MAVSEQIFKELYSFSTALLKNAYAEFNEILLSHQQSDGRTDGPVYTHSEFLHRYKHQKIYIL
jgi:hypothetical protein